MLDPNMDRPSLRQYSPLNGDLTESADVFFYSDNLCLWHVISTLCGTQKLSTVISHNCIRMHVLPSQQNYCIAFRHIRILLIYSDFFPCLHWASNGLYVACVY